jgi:creatinine amidohydrolase
MTLEVNGGGAIDPERHIRQSGPPAPPTFNMLTTRHTREDLRAAACTTAVLPVGAVEQHGRHLPFETDILLAQAMASRLAERLSAYLLPPLGISSSIEHRLAKGTVFIRSETLALVIRDIAACLRDSGFTRLIIANGHGGNWVLKPTVRQLNRDWSDFRTILVSPDPPAAVAREVLEHPVSDVHGGEAETSLMLHLYPDHVRPVAASGEATFPPQGFLDYFDITDLTAFGHWGWPESATAEKGRKIFEAMVASALELIAAIEEQARAIAARK